MVAHPSIQAYCPWIHPGHSGMIRALRGSSAGLWLGAQGRGNWDHKYDPWPNLFSGHSYTQAHVSCP